MGYLFMMCLRFMALLPPAYGTTCQRSIMVVLLDAVVAVERVVSRGSRSPSSGAYAPSPSPTTPPAASRSISSRESPSAPGKVQDAHAPRPRLIHRRHEPEIAHLRILEDLVKLVDRACRDARRLEARHPLGRGRRRQDALHAGLELGVVGQPRLVGGEARIGLHGGIVERY